MLDRKDVFSNNIDKEQNNELFSDVEVTRETTGDLSSEHKQCIHLARRASKNIVGIAQCDMCRQFIALPKLTNHYAVSGKHKTNIDSDHYQKYLLT